MGKAAVLEISKAESKDEKRRAYGTGHIWLRGKKLWVTYYVRGRRIQESAHTSKWTVAEKFLQRKIMEAEDGKIAPQRISYAAMRDALYKDYETRGHKSLLTRADGTRYVGTVPALDEFFREYRADKITTDTIKDFIRARQQAGISNSGINGSLAALRRMFSIQVQENRFPLSLVPHFPMLESNQPRTDFLTKEEYEKLSTELREELRPLLTVAYYTGARKSELLKLKWADVDLKAGVMHFRDTKNGEDRPVTTTPEALAALKGLRAAHPDSEFVFVREKGKPVRDFRKAWELALERAGLQDKLFHGLRRGVVTDLAEAGVPEQVAMAFTGHRDTTTHRRYRQLMLTNLHNASKALSEKRK